MRTCSPAASFARCPSAYVAVTNVTGMVAAAAKAHPRRDRRQRIRHRHDPRAERGGGKPHDPVADRPTFDIRADRADDPGAFQPKGGSGKSVDQRFFRQQPHRPHNVTEIEARPHAPRPQPVQVRRVVAPRPPIRESRDRRDGGSPSVRMSEGSPTAAEDHGAPAAHAVLGVSRRSLFQCWRPTVRRRSAGRDHSPPGLPADRPGATRAAASRWPARVQNSIARHQRDPAFRPSLIMLGIAGDDPEPERPLRPVSPICANAAICCAANSTGSPGQDPSAMKRIVGGSASPSALILQSVGKRSCLTGERDWWPASPRQSCTVTASAASPAATRTGGVLRNRSTKSLAGWSGSPQDGARPRRPGVDVPSADRNPAAASSVHHSSADRRGEPPLARDPAATNRHCAKYHVPERVRLGFNRDKNTVRGEKLPQIRETRWRRAAVAHRR